jgi:hypothetical protein
MLKQRVEYKAEIPPVNLNWNLPEGRLKMQSDENQPECHEIVRNPSKDRSMPEGDNPLF